MDVYQTSSVMDGRRVLSKLRIELIADNMNVYKAPNMQGFLFENVDGEYADRMHQQGIHPYSQYLYRSDGRIYWMIQTLDNEAYEKMVMPFLSPELESFEICRGQIKGQLGSRDLTTVAYEDLMKEFREVKGTREFEIRYLTPTAFRQRGRYYLLPDVRLLMQSLMMKYSSVPQNADMMDEDTLEQLIENVFITRHELRTLTFQVEGKTIPGFTGRTAIRIGGTDTMARYVRLLLRFGEYAGVGIKTGMGMGAIQVQEKKENDER